MYRSVNRLVPSYISDLIPPVVGETTNYPLWNQINIAIPFCSTELFRKSCIPSSISLWNSLDDSLRNSHSLGSFKYHLKRDTPSVVKVPIYYTYGDRFLSVMHARIRAVTNAGRTCDPTLLRTCTCKGCNKICLYYSFFTITTWVFTGTRSRIWFWGVWFCKEKTA